MKIAINTCYGGFSVSEEALKLYCEYTNTKYNPEELNEYEFNDANHRTDSILIQVIEELGERANGRFANIKIIEIPDEINYIIQDYDGVEWVAEVHRTWGYDNET